MKVLNLRSMVAVSAMVLSACAGTKSAKSEPVLADASARLTLSAREAFNQGVALFEAGKFADAKVMFEEALGKEPQMVAAQFNLGLAYERLGELLNAQKAYEVARQLDASHMPSLLNLGKVYREAEKYDEAIALYEAALKEPGREFDVALLNNLTATYRLAKKLDLAEATARKVLSRTKDNADAYKNLSLIYFDLGNYRLAEFVSGNARKLDDKDPALYNNLGLIYLKLEEPRLALANFKRAIALDDNFAPGHMNIGAMALSYRDYETAEKSFAKVVFLEPTSYEGHLAYAYALDGQRSRDPKKGTAAAKAFERVLSLRPNYPQAICGAGWAFSAEKSGYSAAVGYLEKCGQLSVTTAQEKQLIDAKLKGLSAMLNSGAKAAAAVEREKPKAAGGGAALLDKVSDEAAKEEPVPSEPPSENQAQ